MSLSEYQLWPLSPPGLQKQHFAVSKVARSQQNFKNLKQTNQPMRTQKYLDAAK